MVLWQRQMRQSVFSKNCGLVQLCYVLSYISLKKELRSPMVKDAYTTLSPRRFNWNVSHVESVSRVWFSFGTKVSWCTDMHLFSNWPPGAPWILAPRCYRTPIYPRLPSSTGTCGESKLKKHTLVFNKPEQLTFVCQRKRLWKCHGGKHFMVITRKRC